MCDNETITFVSAVLYKANLTTRTSRGLLRLKITVTCLSSEVAPTVLLICKRLNC